MPADRVKNPPVPLLPQRRFSQPSRLRTRHRALSSPFQATPFPSLAFCSHLPASSFSHFPSFRAFPFLRFHPCGKAVWSATLDQLTSYKRTRESDPSRTMYKRTCVLCPSWPALDELELTFPLHPEAAKTPAARHPLIARLLLPWPFSSCISDSRTQRCTAGPVAISSAKTRIETSNRRSRGLLLRCVPWCVGSVSWTVRRVDRSMSGASTPNRSRIPTHGAAFFAVLSQISAKLSFRAAMGGKAKGPASCSAVHSSYCTFFSPASQCREDRKQRSAARCGGIVGG